MPDLLGIIFDQIRRQLIPVSGDLAERDSELILEHTLHLSRTELYTNSKLSVDTIHLNEIQELVRRRLTGIPLPYVLGYTYFYSEKFFVSPDVLIPRPDTEVLIETILHNEQTDNCFFIDVGTGSGIIAKTLTDQRPAWRTCAVDLSQRALKITQKNCGSQIPLFCGDTLCAVKPGKQFDFIVSNPPYISRNEMEELDRSVSEYEPITGLYGGEDGCDFYRRLAEQGKNHLKQNGRIYCEIGYRQKETVTAIFNESGWSDITIHDDLAGRPRVINAAL